MMMILGMFPFMLKTAPYQTLRQVSTWRHAKNDRVGKSPRYQYTGPDEEPVTLSGTLYPEISGGDMSLTMLKTMAYTGKAWPLIEGSGKIYGLYVIAGLTEDRSMFFQDGKARRVDFTLSLKRVSEDIREKLATVTSGDVLSMVKF